MTKKSCPVVEMIQFREQLGNVKEVAEKNVSVDFAEEKEMKTYCGDMLFNA